MSIELSHAVWLNGDELCSIEHLAEVSGLSLDDIEDLVSNGLIDPAASPPRRFRLLHVVTVKQARRLRDDFQLDRHGLSLAMALLRRIDSLEQRLLAQGAARPAGADSADSAAASEAGMRTAPP